MIKVGRTQKAIATEPERDITPNQPMHGHNKELRYVTGTSDNGREFAKHEWIAEMLGIDYYFAHPYHS